MKQDIRDKIREAYKIYGPELISGARLSPYDLGINWIDEFSPIENNVWDAIRYLGLPLYPQYPVGPYFLDFADPKRKIGIEVDSIKWHKDIDKDLKRQSEIESYGWEVYRIPSVITYKIREDFEDEDGGNLDVDAYKTESAEGFLANIYKDYQREVFICIPQFYV